MNRRIGIVFVERRRDVCDTDLVPMKRRSIVRFVERRRDVCDTGLPPIDRRIVMLFVALVGFSIAFPFRAFPCGPFFPSSYVVDGNEERVLALPELSFGRSLEQMGAVEDYPTTRTEGPWGNTLDADLADLGEALKARGTSAAESDAILERYKAMRRQAKIHFDGDEDDHNFLATSSTLTVYPGGFSYRHDVLTTLTMMKAPFDSLPYRDLLTSVPKEFSLYLEGAFLWKAGSRDAAVEKWRALLALAPDQRRYRSTWAAFMIGKSLIIPRPEEAAAAFEQTRALASAGFHDTLGLALDSLGWQGMAEKRKEDFGHAINHYYELYRKGSSDQSVHLADCAARVAYSNRRDRKPIPAEELRRLAADPVVRKVVTAYISSSENGRAAGINKSLQPWNDAVWSARSSIPAGEAEQLAWSSYSAGDVERARQWLAQSKTPSPFGKWVGAKILMRDGKIAEAVEILKSVRHAFPADESPSLTNDYWGSLTKPRRPADGDIGTLQLGRREYVDALDAFLRAHDWADSAYVAERVLTAEELERYIQQHAEDSDLTTTPTTKNEWWSWDRDGDKTTMDDLRHLLARRYARAGEWEKAREYCPTRWRAALDAYARHLQAASVGSAPKRERAGHYIEAARIAREKGMEILGMELDKDCYIVNGVYDEFLSPPMRIGVRSQSREEWREKNFEDAVSRRRSSDARLAEPLRNALSASADEMRRVRASESDPYERFHYRYIAADLMWKAAKLLPDNDTSTALALYSGGTYIQYRSPEKADRFYKALVRRCGKLPVGKEADRLRWFPVSPAGGEASGDISVEQTRRDR